MPESRADAATARAGTPSAHLIARATGPQPMNAARAALRPMERCDRAAVIGLLQRGFPQTCVSFWERGLARQAAVQRDRFGLLLDSANGPVGVLLTLRSQRFRADGSGFEAVNLSSWYIAPQQRLKAAAMLRAALADQAALVTDLTAAESIYRMNTAAGLSAWSSGMVLAGALPWLARRAARGASVRDFTGPVAGLPGWEADLLGWHQRDGCLAAVLHLDDAAVPLLFRPIRRRGVRFAQLIYASDRQLVLAHLPALMRFLVRKRLFFVAIDGQPEMCPSGAYFRPGRRRFWRGPCDVARLDYAYSELVLLGVS